MFVCLEHHYEHVSKGCLVVGVRGLSSSSSSRGIIHWGVGGECFMFFLYC